MNKKLVMLFSLIGVVISASAQQTSVGVMVGVNNSTMRGEDFNLTEYKPGGNIGAFLNYSKKEKSGFRAEVLYTAMGSEFQGIDNEIRLNYLQVPLYAVGYLNDRGHKFRPKIMIGPYVGFLLKGEGSNTDAYYFTTRNFSSVDFGGKGALGFNWNLASNMWLNTELYYGVGFTNAHKTENVNVHNESYGLNVGISFPIK